MIWEIPAVKADRLDRALREGAPEAAKWLSRQAWDALLEAGRVQVDGRKCLKAGTTVAAGAALRVDLPGDLGLLPAPEAAQPLWTAPDESLAVFDKPPGIPTVSLLPWDHTAFANRIERAHPGFAALAEPPSLEGGLVQRLDNDTSGILLAAFTAERKAQLRDLFSRHRVEKTYLALTTAQPRDGWHKLWLRPAGPVVRAFREAPPGESDEVKLWVHATSVSAKGCLVEVTTTFGSRHVVRASLAALGAPLLGDVAYGGSSAEPFHKLHAAKLKFLDKDAIPGFPDQLVAPLPWSFMESAEKQGIINP